MSSLQWRGGAHVRRHQGWHRARRGAAHTRTRLRRWSSSPCAHAAATSAPPASARSTTAARPSARAATWRRPGGAAARAACTSSELPCRCTPGRGGSVDRRSAGLQSCNRVDGSGLPHYRHAAHGQTSWLGPNHQELSGTGYTRARASKVASQAPAARARVLCHATGICRPRGHLSGSAQDAVTTAQPRPIRHLIAWHKLGGAASWWVRHPQVCLTGRPGRASGSQHSNHQLRMWRLPSAPSCRHMPDPLPPRPLAQGPRAGQNPGIGAPGTAQRAHQCRQGRAQVDGRRAAG